MVRPEASTQCEDRAVSGPVHRGPKAATGLALPLYRIEVLRAGMLVAGWLPRRSPLYRPLPFRLRGDMPKTDPVSSFRRFIFLGHVSPAKNTVSPTSPRPASSLAGLAPQTPSSTLDPRGRCATSDPCGRYGVAGNLPLSRTARLWTSAEGATQTSPPPSPSPSPSPPASPSQVG